MEERCRIAHENLTSGTCPWCGLVVTNGRITFLGGSPAEILHLEQLRLNVTPLRAIVSSHGPIEPKTAIEYAIGIIAQLVSHHSETPHKSLSPDIVSIDGSGRPCLGPWWDPDDSFDMSQADKEIMRGVADCLAPEVALCGGKTDQRSDIYGLGCLLFYMLTSQPPFTGEKVCDVLIKHHTEVPASPQTINSLVPESLARICLKMMAKKPTDRYQTMNELKAALAICLNE